MPRRSTATTLFPAFMHSSLSRRSLLNYIGIGILLLGMALGEGIYWRGPRSHSAAGDSLLLDSPYDTRIYQQQMQRTVGIFGLMMDQFSRAMSVLHEPGPLAITVATTSLLIAGLCFLTASFLPHD